VLGTLDGADQTNCDFHGLLPGALLAVLTIGFSRGVDKMDNPFITVLQKWTIE
jgi:hypothetical protein